MSIHWYIDLIKAYRTSTKCKVDVLIYEFDISVTGRNSHKSVFRFTIYSALKHEQIWTIEVTEMYIQVIIDTFLVYEI